MIDEGLWNAANCSLTGNRLSCLKMKSAAHEVAMKAAHKVESAAQAGLDATG